MDELGVTGVVEGIDGDDAEGFGPGFAVHGGGADETAPEVTVVLLGEDDQFARVAEAEEALLIDGRHVDDGDAETFFSAESGGGEGFVNTAAGTDDDG